MKTVKLLSVALLAFILISGCKKGKPDVAKAKTDFQVTATNFFDEYNKNELTADDKYNEKIIELTGTVEMTYDDKNTQSARVTLVTGDEFGSVECTFEQEQKEKALALKEGDLVTIKGYCRGMATNVILNYCILLENKGPDPNYKKDELPANASGADSTKIDTEKKSY